MDPKKKGQDYKCMIFKSQLLSQLEDLRVNRTKYANFWPPVE